MIKQAYKKAAATSVAAVVIAVCLSSCQGRTMKNMEPKGETVEVVISPEPETGGDSLSAPADTISHA